MTAPIKAWVAFLDIYGFSAFLKESEALEHVASALETIRTNAEKRLEKKVTKTYFFSDAIILVQEATSAPGKGFSEIERFIRHLCIEAASFDLALRGAVYFGEVMVDDHICIGQPLVDAYKTEQSLKIPLVVLPEKAMESAQSTGTMKIRGIPRKDGYMNGFAILPSPITLLRDTAARNRDKTSVHGPYDVSEVWHNTYQFCERVLEERSRERNED